MFHWNQVRDQNVLTLLKTLADSAKLLTFVRYGNMEEISETELEDLEKILGAFRPVAAKHLQSDEVNSLMAHMAEVVHYEFYSDEVKMPWPDYVLEEDRELIRNAVREMLNGLIAKRFMSELKRVVEAQ